MLWRQSETWPGWRGFRAARCPTPCPASVRSRATLSVASRKPSPNSDSPSMQVHRALATAQTMSIGLLSQFHQDEFAPAMLPVHPLRVRRGARELGYDVLFVTDGDGASAVKRITSSNQVDGVVLLDVTHADPRVAPLRDARQPGALIGLPGRHRGPRRLRPRLRRVRPHARRPPLRAWAPRDHPHQPARARLRARRRIRLALQRRRRRARGSLRDPHPRSLRRVPAARDRRQHQRDPRRAQDRHRDDRPQRRDGRRAALSCFRSAASSFPTTCRSRASTPEDFGRIFSLPYTAVESSPDKLGRLAVQQLVRRILDPDQAGPTVVKFIAPELMDRGSTA